jgi:surfactin synthase thioesterase subunit
LDSKAAVLPGEIIKGHMMSNTTTLFCLPHAGGSSSTYLTWKRFMPQHIVLRPIELPGRGKRIREPLYHSIEEAIDGLYDMISQELDNTAYAFFGHSMGTILAYELIRKIKDNHHQEPVHMFFSGRFPPFIHDDREWLHTLPDDQFIDNICEIGGTTREVFKNKELREILLPVLRADYGMVERYRHQGEAVMLDCDITVFNGTHDTYVNNMDLRRWQECSRSACTFHEFDGDHFFIQPFKEEIAGIIQRTLASEA